MTPPVTVEVVTIATCDCDNMISELTLHQKESCEGFTVFAQKSLVYFTNNYEETASSTLN